MNPCVSCGKESNGKYGNLSCCLDCYESGKAREFIADCCMCKEPFKKEELDFLGRCEPCFHKYMSLPDDQKPKLGVPFVPIYNGKDKYGF